MQAWQATVQDEFGNVVFNPQVTVYLDDGVNLADIYNEDGSSKANPFIGSLEGFAQFWAESGSYKVKASGSELWDVTLTDPYSLFQSYDDALSAIKPEGVDAVSAIVNGIRTDWIRQDGGPCLGGGWAPAHNVTPEHFGGDLVAAHATGDPVNYGSHLWPGDAFGGYLNLYGSNKYRKSLYDRVQIGRINSSGLPIETTSDPNPIISYQKFSIASRDNDPGAWDQVGYFGLNKSAGDAYGAALTGYGRHYGGEGDVIGIHGRHRGTHRNAKGWGMWAYALAQNTEDRQIDLIGIEINVVNRWTGQLPFVPDSSHLEGEYRGLVVSTADGGGRINTAISVSAQQGTGGFNHGLKFRLDAVEGDTVAGGRSGAILIEGRRTPSNGRPIGVIFGPGYFRSGIDFLDMTQPFDRNLAIRMREGDRVSWGQGGTVYIVKNTEDNFLDVRNMYLGINGLKVVGARNTGWTGTSSYTGGKRKSGFNTATVTLEQLAEVVAAQADALLKHGLIGS